MRAFGEKKSPAGGRGKVGRNYWPWYRAGRQSHPRSRCAILPHPQRGHIPSPPPPPSPPPCMVSSVAGAWAADGVTAGRAHPISANKSNIATIALCRVMRSPHISSMPPLDLTDAEAAALATHLRHAIGADPYPLSPRLAPLRAILDKIEPPAPRPEPLPPLPAGAGPRVGRGKRRWRGA